MRFLLLCSALLALPPRSAAAAGHEPALEAPVQALLADLLGPGRARVFIRTEYKGTESPLPSTLWGRMSRRMENVPQILPGFALPLNMREEALRALARRRPRPALIVTVILDAGVPADRARAALSTTSQALGLDPARGDEMRALRAALAPPPEPPAAPRAALLAACLLALAGVLLAARSRPGRTEASAPDWPDCALFFASLKLKDAPALARFLSGENPSAAARALAELRPALAAEVFSRLPAPLRRAASLALLQVPRRGRWSWNPISRLRGYMEARSAGPGLLEEILRRCPDPVKEGTLAHLSLAAPRTAADLRRRLPTWKDFLSADGDSLRAALSALSCEEAALCLYDEPSSSPLLAALPPSLAERIRTRLRSLVPASLDQVERLRAGVLARFKSPAAAALLCFLLLCACAAPRGEPRPSGEPTLSEAEILEGELYRQDPDGGERDAQKALEAYRLRDNLRAVLSAQAALGSDPGNPSRRKLLQFLKERTGIEPDPDGILPRAALIQHELRRADDAFLDGRLGAAILACRRALALDPENPGAWLRLGSSQFALGEKTQARTAYLRALALNPKDASLKRFFKEQRWKEDKQ